MWANLKTYWFLLALAVCSAVGYFATAPLEPLLSQTWLRNGIVFAVMWAMGVTLKADTVRASLSRPTAALLAIGMNVAVVPILCLPAAWVLSESLFGGLFVAAIVPCTLASASVWTRKAGGDDSIAMLTTVVTNLACLVVAPLGVWLVLAATTQVSAAQQISKLALLVVAPLIAAQLMRRLGAAPWADRNKARLGMFGQLGILAMVVFGSAHGAGRVLAETDRASDGSGIGFQGVDFGLMIFAAVAVHVLALALGIGAARGLGCRRDAQIAVGIAGSQKTLMVGLQIAIDCGVSVIPMLVYHLGQLVIDTLVGQRWSRKTREQARSSEREDEPAA